MLKFGGIMCVGGGGVGVCVNGVGVGAVAFGVSRGWMLGGHALILVVSRNSGGEVVGAISSCIIFGVAPTVVFPVLLCC